MFFDHYPYTNFHNVNLDWVLQAVKAWGQTVEANDRAFRDLKEANEDFKKYVRNYLQDLDITDEINTKLDNMLASGILTPYFAPYVKGYVDSWLASHVTPTSPALDSTLTLSGAAARADSTGKRLKDLAYIDALSTPEIIAALNRSQVLPGYRVQGIAYDYNGHYYVCGGSVDETGTGVIVKMTKPDFTDAEITEIPQLGHANDITYYDGYLYVCTVGGGDAPRWGIYKINVNDFTDKTLISNAPENTIGISYRQGDFWILAPYRIYRTTDFTSYEVVVANTNDLLTAYGIPTSGRISQTIFRAAGYLIGWVCSFVFEDRHYGALTFFNSAGEAIAFKMFPAYHTEIQGAVYADMSIYLVADGNMVNVFRMDPRHLSYVQLKAGDDLNSFTGRGTLYSTGSNVSAELLNSPSSGEGFTVQVDRLGVYNTIQTARTNSGRELYRIKSFNSDTWGEWIEPAAEVAELKEDLSSIGKTTLRKTDIRWFVGKSVDSSGTIQNNTAAALSNVISVAEGTRIKRVGASADSENRNLTMYVNAYENMVFKSRSILGKDTIYTVPSDVNALCFGFARAGSYGVDMTAEDIDNYFGVEWHFATESSVDAEQTRNSGDYLDNLLEKFCVFGSGSSNGITYDLIDSETHSYYVHGSTSGSISIFNLYNGLLPGCLERGKRYFILYENTAEARNCYARFIFYDKDGNVTQPEAFGYPYAVTIPDNACTVIFRLYVGKNQTVDTTIKYLKLVEVQEQKMSVPYIISFVDDDASSTTYVERYYNSCKRNGINGNYAVITNKFENGATDPDMLLGYEDDGMAMLIHCSEQSYSVAPEWMDRDYDGCRKNLYKGMRAMQEKGFVNYRYWVMPYGYVNDDFKRLAVDAGMECMISSANFTYNDIAHFDRYHIKRFSLNPVDTEGSKGNLAAIKTAIDEMQNLPSCWMIITTHFNEWGSVTWDSTVDATGFPVGYERMNEIIQYAKASGASVLTVPEAWRFYEPILEANEQRYNTIRP